MFNIIGEIIIAFASVAGNALVLVLIMKDKQLHTVTNYFIASLAAADLLVGALGIPCVLIAWHGYPHNFIGCLTVNSVIVVLTQISIFGLLTIAIERFIAIKEPFKYKEFLHWKDSCYLHKCYLVFCDTSRDSPFIRLEPGTDDREKVFIYRSDKSRIHGVF